MEADFFVFSVVKERKEKNRNGRRRRHRVVYGKQNDPNGTDAQQITKQSAKQSPARERPSLFLFRPLLTFLSAGPPVQLDKYLDVASADNVFFFSYRLPVSVDL